MVGDALTVKIEVEFLSEHIYEKHILLGTALVSLFALGPADYNEDNFPDLMKKKPSRMSVPIPRIG